MELKTVGIHRLRLCDELKRELYQKPNSAQLEEYRDLGFLNPVIVCPVPESSDYEILRSEEAWFAAQQLGIHDIPVSVVRPDSKIEKRKYLKIDSTENPIAKANRYQLWLDFEPGRNKTSLSVLEGCTRSSISHQIRLLSFEQSIQDLLASFQISTAHGKELLKYPAGQGRAEAANLAAEKCWSVSRLKLHLSRNNDSVKMKTTSLPKTEKDANTVRLEKDLTGLVGSAVTIDLDSGELKIDYGKNFDILDGIIRKLGYRQ